MKHSSKFIGYLVIRILILQFTEESEELEKLKQKLNEFELDESERKLAEKVLSVLET